MPEVTFDLQIVTPLFLAGANQREIDIPINNRREGEKTTAWEYVPEIRSPAFRGLMRYWLRAAVAGLITMQPLSLEDIRDFEQSIFGATDQGSTVLVRARTITAASQVFKKESHSQDQITGKDYLYWSMDKSAKGNNFKPARHYLTDATKLNLTLSVHGQDDIQAHKLECAIAAFWLLKTLGGLGSRSRRCAGSLTVTNVSGNTTKLSFVDPHNADELQQMLRDGIQEVKRLYATHLAQLKVEKKGTTRLKPLGKIVFDTLAFPDYCRIWILQRRDQGKILPWRNVDKAIEDIGIALQAYRRGIGSLESRATFGLPLILQQQIRDQKLKKALKDHRRASPLLLKVCRLNGGECVVIAVLFKTSYEPIDNTIPIPNYSLIEDWLGKRLSSMAALEVII